MAVAAIVIAVASVVYLRPGGRVAQPAARPQVMSYPGPAYFLSARTGWVALSGSLLATSDGGRSWRRLRNLPNLQVTWMQMFDDRHGLVLGFTRPDGARVERLLRTDDGGAHWTDEPLPSSDLIEQAGSVAAFTDPARGWYVAAVTAGAGPQDLSLYRTDDGGIHWTRLAALDYLHPADHGLVRGGRPTALEFTDATHGWLVQAPVVVEDAALSMTTDAGASWQSVALPAPSGDPVPLSYLTVPTVFPNGTALVWAVRGFAGGTAYIYRSSDGGRTWGAPARLEQPIGATAFVDPNHWWRPAGRVAARTSDAGRSWHRGGQAPNGLTIAWLQPVSDRIAWAIGVKPSFASAELLRTDDGAADWSVVPLQAGS